MAKTAAARSAGATPATRWLQAQGVPFTEHVYDYVDHGGAAHAAQCLGLPLHAVVKTLVMQDDAGRPLLVLMHGDREVGLQALARAAGVKRIEPCRPDAAERASGYQVGGTSPFGTRKAMPVFVESGILALSRCWINGGRRGLLVGIEPRAVLGERLGARPVQCAQPQPA
jgi:Cys-tRNA(Pro) deacylase